MKKIVYFLLVLTFVSVTVSSIAAQDGLALLRVSHGARQAGFGEAVVSIADDVNGSVYNPASLRNVEKFKASFGHTEYWENISMESGFFVLPISKKINWHGGIRFAADEKLEERTNPSVEPISEFDYNDISMKTGVTFNRDEKMSVGVSVGWLYEKNNRWSGSSFNIDLGMLYKKSDKLSFGASILNYGSDITLTSSDAIESNPIPLPTRYSTGASFTHQKFRSALDVVYLDDDIKIHVGAERNVHEMLDLRAGYMFNYDSKDFSAGATFTKRNIKVDYAFVPYSNNHGSSHLFNFTFQI